MKDNAEFQLKIIDETANNNTKIDNVNGINNINERIKENQVEKNVIGTVESFNIIDSNEKIRKLKWLFKIKEYSQYSNWILIFDNNINYNVLWIFFNNLKIKDLWFNQQIRWKLNIWKVKQLIWKEWYIKLYIYARKDTKIRYWMWTNNTIIIPYWITKILFYMENWELKAEMKIRNWITIEKNITYFEIADDVFPIYIWFKILSPILSQNSKTELLLNAWMISKYIKDWTINFGWIKVYYINWNSLWIEKVYIKSDSIYAKLLNKIKIYISPLILKYLKNWKITEDFIENTIDITSLVLWNNKEYENSVFNNNEYIKLFNFEDWTPFSDKKKVWIYINDRYYKWNFKWENWNKISWKIREYYFIYPWSKFNNWLIKWNILDIWKLIDKKWNIYIFPLIDKEGILLGNLNLSDSYYKYMPLYWSWDNCYKYNLPTSFRIWWTEINTWWNYFYYQISNMINFWDSMIHDRWYVTLNNISYDKKW